jgi:hypothetical protein
MSLTKLAELEEDHQNQTNASVDRILHLMMTKLNQQSNGQPVAKQSYF